MDFEDFFEIGVIWSERVQMQVKSILGERYGDLDALRTFVWTNPSIFEVVMAFWSFFTEISTLGYYGRRGENGRKSARIQKAAESAQVR